MAGTYIKRSVLDSLSEGYSSISNNGRLDFLEEVIDTAEENQLGQHTIGFYRDSNDKIKTIESDSNEIRTDRQIDTDIPIIFGNWVPHRKARNIPLAVEKMDFASQSKSKDYDFLPDEVKTIFDGGNLLRTSPCKSSDFSALMYVLESCPPTGRTGVLLYKGEPVITKIDDQEYIVEIKGVGVPNGDNSIKYVMARSSFFGSGKAKYGGLEVEQGRREFRNLEILREENSKTFQEGNSPRAALLIEYDGGIKYWGANTDQAYLLRLAPASVRASFNGNDAFPDVEEKANKTAKDLAEQHAELMSLESILIHTCAHPENLVLTNDGFKFTDFSDMRLLAELENPHRIVTSVLKEFVGEIPNKTDTDIEDYGSTLCEKLGIEWEDSYKNLENLSEAVWRQFAAPKVFELRKSGMNLLRDKTISSLEAYFEAPRKLTESDPDFIPDINLAIHTISKYLESEIKLLTAVGNEEAMHSVSFAEEKLEELTKSIEEDQLYTIIDRLEENEDYLRDMMDLPYAVT